MIELEKQVKADRDNLAQALEKARADLRKVKEAETQLTQLIAKQEGAIQMADVLLARIQESEAEKPKSKKLKAQEPPTP